MTIAPDMHGASAIGKPCHPIQARSGESGDTAGRGGLAAVEAAMEVGNVAESCGQGHLGDLRGRQSEEAFGVIDAYTRSISLKIGAVRP